uniref:Phospholipid/glycerol acyltransferase domain-containing protein n=1 Tax=Kalanchoe fedtschenkoi TaxID=63787 RepID=A0A7N1A5F6_KALFE
MESELTAISSANPTKPDPLDTFDESNSKDDRPLLRPVPIRSDDNRSQQANGDLENKYAAFVRKDAYGTMGRGDLPVGEKLMLGLALVTLVPVRVVLGFTILLVYYFICRAATLFKAPNREEDNEQEDFVHMGGYRRLVIFQCGRFFSRVMLFVLGFYWIQVTIRYPDENEGNDLSDEQERAGAIISNHVSYIDILYHMSTSFPSFVAKRSVAKLPLVGLISKCLGCVFVQRESKSSDFKGVSGTQSTHAAKVLLSCI